MKLRADQAALDQPEQKVDKTMITLRIAGTDSDIPDSDLTIERIIAEAHSMGYQEFAVFCNDNEIITPEEFKVIKGAIYTIIPTEDHIINSDEEEDFEILRNLPQVAEE